MPRIPALVACLSVVLACGLLARLLPRDADRLDALWAPLRSAFGPVLIGVFAVVVVFLAGPERSLHRTPIIQDEYAYLLQAQLFASGRWVAAARPLPYVFCEILTLVTPVAAGKYTPGMPLVLVPGVWLGTPSVMPLVLAGVTAAGMFAIARRVAGEIVATLTVVLWLSLVPTLRWEGTYMSEVASGAAWIVACWALLRWVRTRDSRALALVGAAVGAITITRPYTAVALTVPIAVVVIGTVARRRAWRPLAVALVCGGVIVGLMPLQNHFTTGSWRLSPVERYRRTYIPFDKLGFGFDSTPPTLPMTPDLDSSMVVFRAGHRGYVRGAVPVALVKRAVQISKDVWAGPWLGLLPFAVLALVGLPVEGWFGLASVGSLVAFYLLYWHMPQWTVYYVEVEPALCFVTMVGVVRAATRVGGARARGRSPAAFALMILPLLWVMGRRARDGRDRNAYVPRTAAYFTHFKALLATIPSPRSIVFVRYGPHHDVNWTLVHNPPDLPDARVWIVYDVDSTEATVRRLAPARTAYRFDEATWTITALPPLDSPRSAE
jgi:Dolichyl-phosphate-mannose-protein mannosyltransferase